MDVPGGTAGRQASEIDARIGARLRLQRQARRMSLEQVADAIGISYQQVRKYETGDNRISVAALCRIAAALRVDVRSLLPDAMGSGEGQSGSDETTDVEAQIQQAADRLRIMDPALRHRLCALIASL